MDDINSSGFIKKQFKEINFIHENDFEHEFKSQTQLAEITFKIIIRGKCSKKNIKRNEPRKLAG